MVNRRDRKPKGDRKERGGKRERETSTTETGNWVQVIRGSRWVPTCSPPAAIPAVLPPGWALLARAHSDKAWLGSVPGTIWSSERQLGSPRMGPSSAPQQRHLGNGHSAALRCSRSVVQLASTAALDIRDAVVSRSSLLHNLTLCGIVLAGKPFSFVLCPRQGYLWSQRFIRFFWKGSRWTEVISMGCSLGSLNLPLFWEAWFNVACSFVPGLLYIGG